MFSGESLGRGHEPLGHVLAVYTIHIPRGLPISVEVTISPLPTAASKLSSLRQFRRGRPSRRAAQRVAVIGAGPNGLATTAHLRYAGVNVRCFGEPLEFWRRAMPAGMILRSTQRSSSIADPQRRLTVARYEAASGRTLTRPALTLSEFVDYGLWYADQAVPDVDRRRVTRVRRAGPGFSLQLDDGTEMEFDRVVVATGLALLSHQPAPFDSYTGGAVEHASEHHDLAAFTGRQVVVIGAGQSAIESAALLREQGAQVEVIMRSKEINWLPLPPSDTARRLPRRPTRLPVPPTDIGGGGPRDAWVAAIPEVFRRLDPDRRLRITFRCTGPAASGWLRPRVDGVTFTPGRSVGAVCERPDGRVTLTLDDQAERVADHVLLGTGYAVDVRRYPFLGADIFDRLEMVAGYPLLGPGLEASISGLHFVGAPATRSFGPIMRFVVGSAYAAPAVTRQIIGGPRPPIRFAF